MRNYMTWLQHLNDRTLIYCANTIVSIASLRMPSYHALLFIFRTYLAYGISSADVADWREMRFIDLFISPLYRTEDTKTFDPFRVAQSFSGHRIQCDFMVFNWETHRVLIYCFVAYFSCIPNWIGCMTNRKKQSGVREWRGWEKSETRCEMFYATPQLVPASKFVSLLVLIIQLDPSKLLI